MRGPPALVSGMCTSLLLVVGFVSAFLRLRHEYGATFLFTGAGCVAL